MKQSKEETSSRLSSYFAPTTGPRPLSAALTLIQPKNPFLATGVSTHPQPSTKEVIKRLGPGDLVPEMTLAEQYHIVAALLRKKDLRTGEVWYLVDKGWWNSWLKASGNSNDLHLKVAGIRYTMEAIDNSQLVDPSTYDLRQGLVARVSKLEEVRGPAQGDIFVAVPREVWEDCLVRWYAQLYLLPLTPAPIDLCRSLGMENPCIPSRAPSSGTGIRDLVSISIPEASTLRLKTRNGQ